MSKSKFSRSNWLILILFGLIGQIAWSVENMYFNLYVFDEISPNLSAVTLMVQLSGIVATVATLIAGTLSDKAGNRRSFISFGYIIWGVTVALFGFISPELMGELFGVGAEEGVKIALVTVIVGDCIMTLFGSTANDASFNSWVTDNTTSDFRGTVEGVIAILPLASMIIVAGGFGMLVSAIGYATVFLVMGIVISLSGLAGVFLIKDSPSLEKNGSMKDILYGFRPDVIKGNAPFYLTLVIILVYGIACQIFMPYMIIYMKTYLSFSVIEYSLVFGAAIILGAAINLYLGRLSDRKNKVNLMYFAAGVMALGLFGMYLAPANNKTAALLIFGVFGFVMISGYIFVSALSGSMVRDYTPEMAAGRLQGVRMVFSVLIPMLVGPAVGNAINKARGIRLENAGADAMTTEYIPAPEIFLVGALVTLLIFALIPLLSGLVRRKEA